MGYAIAISGRTWSFVGTIKKLFCPIAIAIHFAIWNHAIAAGTINSISKVEINRQAERMLQDYGNAVLRLAYS